MSGFKDSTKTVSGFHHWGGGSIGGGGTGGTINRLAHGGSVDKIDSNPRHAEVYPAEGDRMHGNAATLRKESPTQELEEHGGKTPLISKFKKGGPTKHFHVHKHYHAKGGRTHTVSHSYGAMEKHAETYAGGGHVHDCTEVPAGGPDYAKGGKTKGHTKLKSGKKPVHKNAGGALYAPGGLVAPPRPVPPTMAGNAPQSALGRLAMRPPGLPVRQAPPMRRPMPMPGPSPLMGAAPRGPGVR